ncbi:hypothetical protein BD769DRAFT_1779014 [Suillus cothurnatus]|nr:hypothetical protein BD769DRAFT_1779014 [Suillus cothurnatus]
MDEVRLAINSRRLFIMAIAPEFVITWAMRQIFGAYAAANDFNYESGVQCAQTHIDDRVISGNSFQARARAFPDLQIVTTMTHGFFTRMGGFTLHITDKPQATLTPDEHL